MYAIKTPSCWRYLTDLTDCLTGVSVCAIVSIALWIVKINQLMGLWLHHSSWFIFFSFIGYWPSVLSARYPWLAFYYPMYVWRKPRAHRRRKCARSHVFYSSAMNRAQNTYTWNTCILRYAEWSRSFSSIGRIIEKLTWDTNIASKKCKTVNLAQMPSPRMCKAIRSYASIASWGAVNFST